MPIALLVTEGLLSDQAQRAVFRDLTNAFLRHHALEGNAFLTPNVIGDVSEIPRGKSFAGGEPAEIAIVELKVPSFALSTAEQKQGFIADATEAVVRASAGRLPKDHVWVNVVFAADGLWGIAGDAYANDRLLAAVGAG